MGSLIAALVARGWSERAARLIAHAGLILVILAAMGTAVCAIRKDAVEDYTGKEQVKQAKEDRKADQKAADQRMDDIARQNDEAQEIKEAVNEARNDGRDPRAAYYECVRLQQAARRQHKPPAEC